MNEITATNLRRQLRDALKSAETGKTVRITRHGKTVAALVGPEELALLDTANGVTKTAPQPASAPMPENVDANGTPVEVAVPATAKFITEVPQP